MANAVNAVYQLSAFSESERKTLRLISAYLSERGQRCFTYRGLRGYYNRNKVYRELEWHTAERNLRKLAELGWLERRIYAKHRGGKAVVFCLSPNLEHLLQQLGWLR